MESCPLFVSAQKQGLRTTIKPGFTVANEIFKGRSFHGSWIYDRTPDGIVRHPSGPIPTLAVLIPLYVVLDFHVDLPSQIIAACHSKSSASYPWFKDAKYVSNSSVFLIAFPFQRQEAFLLPGNSQSYPGTTSIHETPQHPPMPHTSNSPAPTIQPIGSVQFLIVVVFNQTGSVRNTIKITALIRNRRW